MLLIFAFAVLMTGTVWLVIQGMERGVFETPDYPPAWERGAIADPEALDGQWQYGDSKASAKLILDKGIFRIIYQVARNPAVGSYAHGHYRIRGHVLILEQRDDITLPVFTVRRGVQLFPMPFDSLAVKLEIRENRMLWTLPFAEMTYEQREFWNLFQRGTRETALVDVPMIWVREER